MNKKSKKTKKTLIEKILDQKKIPYEQLKFHTVQQGDVQQLDTSILDENEELVYKTLVCDGNKISPIVAVLPINKHLSMKKLAKASGNKKCELLPLKKLVATTGYVHGANTPIGIYEKNHFPIYYDQQIADEDKIVISSGEVGRSVKMKPKDLYTLTEGILVDLLE